MARKQKRSGAGGFAEEGQTAFGGDRYFVELGAGGRVVIPAALRAALGMKPGGRLIIDRAENELRVYTQREGIRRARELIRKFVPEGVSLVDELIADRRKEAARELKDTDDE